MTFHLVQSMILSNIQEPEYLTLASRALDVCRLDEVSVQIELPWSNASYIRPTFQNTSKVYSRRPITILHPPMWRQTRPCGGERKLRASNFCDPPTPRVGSQCWRGDCLVEMWATSIRAQIAKSATPPSPNDGPSTRAPTSTNTSAHEVLQRAQTETSVRSARRPRT